MYVYAEVGYVNAYTTMHYFTFVRPVSRYYGASNKEANCDPKENISEVCD